tara:strand:- start:841 stop:1065 length:225 start_codon:yes stop_codon:yes gene_type:complete
MVTLKRKNTYLRGAQCDCLRLTVLLREKELMRSKSSEEAPLVRSQRMRARRTEGWWGTPMMEQVIGRIVHSCDE